MMDFVGSHVGGKLFDWTIEHGVLFFAGSEEERRVRRVFEEAAPWTRYATLLPQTARRLRRWVRTWPPL